MLVSSLTLAYNKHIDETQTLVAYISHRVVNIILDLQISNPKLGNKLIYLIYLTVFLFSQNPTCMYVGK